MNRASTSPTAATFVGHAARGSMDEQERPFSGSSDASSAHDAPRAAALCGAGGHSQLGGELR